MAGLLECLLLLSGFTRHIIECQLSGQEKAGTELARKGSPKPTLALTVWTLFANTSGMQEYEAN
jgi:hypothetical protein